MLSGLKRIPQSLSLSWLLLASVATAQSLDALSFGHKGDISQNGQGVPGWHSSSSNHELQVLRDRIVLTPPVPGNAKGALWSDTPSSSAEWTAELSFRASGQETGSGNLQVWYTKNRDSIGTSSVYNSPKFDGLVLVVDQYGGSGGKIRGFLNDGGVDFRTKSSLESLAFGHCDYSYRNLGRPSKLKISSQGGLTVSIDDKPCFSSNKISLPAGYYFGITASTGENPDSFEVQKFIVSAGGDQSLAGHTQQQSSDHPPAQQRRGDPYGNHKMDAMPGSPEMLPDRDADQIKSQTEQFEDLHNRVQALTHHMGTLYYEIKSISDKIDAKNAEVLLQLQNVKGSRDTGLPPETVGKISKIEDRVGSIETTANIIRNDLEGKDYKESLDALHRAMSFLHHNFQTGIDGKMEYAIKTHSPSYTFVIVAIIGWQVLLAIAYVAYKRRKHGAPKKYL